ncbi:MAG: pirin family protein [Pseudomonadota bacterium]
MMTLRRSEDRGHADHGWLDARHSFSFSDYHDPKWMGYSSLRVINEDRVAPGTGFSTHGHRDMEIITYPLSGSIRHQDSTGGNGLISHGEIQVMHAGRGIRHSEVNPSHTEPLHLLQIWIEPNAVGVAPGYEQDRLDPSLLSEHFALAVAPVGSADAAPFRIHSDARLFVAWPKAGTEITQALQPTRRHYLHVALGGLQLGNQTLKAGDALLIEGERSVQFKASADSEVLLFELP